MSAILIVEDDKKLNDGIRLALKNPKDQLIQCRTIQDAREVFQKSKLDLILLDLNLPDGNGMDFLTEIRKCDQTPIILITANNMETDIVIGLEAGANDYITKPFSLMVLRARVEVQLRQNQRETNSNIVFGNFEFDFEKMNYKVAGVLVELSKTEQKLLRILFENRGRTLTRERLIDYVWSGESEFVDEHALTVAIKRLRDKLSDGTESKEEIIKTVYGIGYTWTSNS